LDKLSGLECSTIAIFLIIFLIPALASGISPSTNKNVTYLTYENSTTGIRIDYPKDWTPLYGMAFMSPKENDSDTFREGLVVSRGPHGNESIEKLAADVVKFYNSSLPNFKLLQLKGQSFQGNPAQNITYTFNLPGNGTIKVMEFGSTEGDKIHIFRYAAQESKFNSYLPIISRMMDSFKSIK